MGLTSLEDTVKDQAKKRNNAHFMLLDGMSNLMTEKIKRFHSLDFHAYGLKWRLLIRSDNAKNYVSVYLNITDEQCADSNWGVNCNFKLGVVSPIGAPDICIPFEFNFDSRNKSWGRHNFMSLEVLKQKYLVNDKAVFCAEITGVTPRFLKVTSISGTLGTAERVNVMEVPRNNSKFTWKITKFSSFDGEKHSSYEFTVGPRRWFLEMYPKGFYDGKGNSLSLFLHASDFVSNGPVKATSVIFKLRVLDQLKRNHRELKTAYQFTSNSSWGFRNFLELEELHKASNGYLVNDEIYIGVEFLFVSTHEYL